MSFPSARRSWLPPLAAVAGLAAALGPLLFDIAGRLWVSPRFGHAPLVWAAVAGLIAWRLRDDALHRDAEHPAPPPRPVPELALWGFALTLAAGAVWLATPWLALAAAFCAVPAAVYSAAGGAGLRSAGPAWAVLWLTLPPPFRWDELLVVRLQRVAADLASSGLDLLGRRHLPAGVTMELPGRSFFVEEACSGVNGLYALLAAAGLLLAWGRRGPVRAAVVLAAAVLWAVAANAVRVVAAVELTVGAGLPVAEGLGHDLLSAATFAVAAGLTLSTDFLLLYARPRRQAFDPEWIAAGPRAGGRFPPLPRAAVWGGAAAALFLLAGWRLAARPAGTVVAVADAAIGADRSALKPVDADSLPAAWEGWRRVGFETVERDLDHPDGTFSAVWTYRRGPLTAAISMDGPFAAGWHDLAVCYTNGGWSCTAAVDRTDGPGPDGDAFTRLDLEEPLRRGVVFFTSYSLADDGNVGPVTTSRSKLTGRFPELRVLVSPSGDRRADPVPAYQVQAYAATYRTFSEAETGAVRELFDAMRRRIAELPAAGGSAANLPEAGA